MLLPFVTPDQDTGIEDLLEQGLTGTGWLQAGGIMLGAIAAAIGNPYRDEPAQVFTGQPAEPPRPESREPPASRWAWRRRRSD